MHNCDGQLVTTSLSAESPGTRVTVREFSGLSWPVKVSVGHHLVYVNQCRKTQPNSGQHHSLGASPELCWLYTRWVISALLGLTWSPRVVRSSEKTVELWEETLLWDFLCAFSIFCIKIVLIIQYNFTRTDSPLVLFPMGLRSKKWWPFALPVLELAL